MPPAVLAVDAGQTATRSVAVDSAGRVTGRSTGPGVRHVASHGSIRRTRRLLAEVCAGALGAGACVDVAVVCVSGWSADPMYSRRLLAAVQEVTPARRVLLTSDAITAFVGGSDALPGVVVAAGTGCVALAADGTGQWCRADGLGYLLGDLGSGFWIGREALASALSRASGRSGSDELLRRAIDHFGPVAELVDRLSRSRDPVPLVAGFTLLVAEAARSGDPISQRIWTDAGRALAISACNAADGVFPHASPVTVTLTGGLASAEDLLLLPLDQTLQQRRPGTTVRARDQGPLQGAIDLGLHPEFADWFPQQVLFGRGLMADEQR
jgi:N-acetylglucosamine kinase-like BadF-type ATPase